MDRDARIAARRERIKERLGAKLGEGEGAPLAASILEQFGHASLCVWVSWLRRAHTARAMRPAACRRQK